MANNYRELNRQVLQGWNTWYVRSMTAHVLMPQGMTISLALKDRREGPYLGEVLKGPQKVYPGFRSYDGSYTDLTLEWEGLRLRFETALDGMDWVARVKPDKHHPQPSLLVAECGMLWNRTGHWERDGDTMRGCAGGTQVVLYPAAPVKEEPCVWTLAPYLAQELRGAAGLSTGRRRTLDEIGAILTRNRAREEQRLDRFGELAEVYRAASASLAWNTIYDPIKDRAITPVARTWCTGHGWVLFEWDTYFAAYMLSLDNLGLAMLNAAAITDEITPEGLVPNFATAQGYASRDRSEPPVGAWVCRELYRAGRARWFVEQVYPKLLVWNRWWWKNRRNRGDLLSWGSTPYTPALDAYWERTHVNERIGASLESGLDNSPMYDDVPFDSTRHLLELHDVGLCSLYTADCEALADLADVLGRAEEAAELRDRARKVRAAMKSELWDDSVGLFLNRRTDTGEFSRRVSPTHFYPMLAGVASQEQAGRMVREHLYNPAEFWGEWVLPSIARNDPAYPEQSYWRGRVWGPMNFLVYIALRRAGMKQACRDLAAKSKALLLKGWLAHGHVCENYNAETGDTTVTEGKMGGDSFYYWGGLLGTVALMEEGFYPDAGTPLGGG